MIRTYTHIICLMITTISPADPLIIWEPNQTIFTYQEEAMIKQLDWHSIYANLGVLHAAKIFSQAAYQHYTQQSIRSEILNALSIQSECEYYTPYYFNQQVPHIMKQWLLGMQHSQAIFESYDLLKSNLHLREPTRELLAYIVPTMFDPEKLVSGFQPDDDACNLLYTLSMTHTNVACSNIHDDLISYLRTRENMRPALDTFDAAYTSHALGKLKPDPSIIDIIAQDYGTSREHCIVIESEPQHHATFTRNGIYSIQYQDAQQVYDDIKQITHYDIR